jgi:hypothetical protein
MAPTPQSALSLLHAKERARINVVITALRLTAAGWQNDRDEEETSPELEQALDEFDKALSDYVNVTGAADAAIEAETKQQADLLIRTIKERPAKPSAENGWDCDCSYDGEPHHH